MGFDSSKKQLKDWLRRIHEGQLQLPDFQRGWVWSDEAIRSLVASIANGYPVGALLTLETGGAVQFKPRLVEGVPPQPAQPEELLLDGQQRMTSLYQSLYAQGAVKTRDERGKPIERFYYLDVARASQVDGVTEDLVISVPATRIIKGPMGHTDRLDVSTPEREYEQHLFPLNQGLDEREWVRRWRLHWDGQGKNIRDLEDVLYALTQRIQRYEMPVIKLDRDNSRSAICTVFEKVNTGGKKLDAFELLTAVYAAEPVRVDGQKTSYFDLREDWVGDATAKPPLEGRAARLRATGQKGNVLHDVASTDFLQVCLLMYSQRQRQAAALAGKTGKDLPPVTARNDDLLDLPRAAYLEHADKVQKGFVEAAQFLNGERILFARDVPYPPQLVALAAVFADQDKTLPAGAQKRLRRWYWAVALSESYSASTETKLARDVPELLKWLHDDAAPQPRTLDEALFQADRLDSLRSRIASAYKAVQNLLVRQGCLDFMSGKPFDLMTTYTEPIDVHHIFPEKWCRDKQIEPRIYNSILNKTPLSAESNRSIGGDAPSCYLLRIEKQHAGNKSVMDDILRSHLIDPELLRADDFHGFMAARKQALAQNIGAAMGRPVVFNPTTGAALPGAALDDVLSLDEPVEA